MRFLVLCGSLFLAIQAASADPTAAAKGKVKNLPERVYHLNYVKTSDIEAVIKPLLSSKRTIETASAPAKDGTGTLVVRDDEQVLKSVDRVVTNVDVPPAQVLVEATIIEVTLNKATRESKGLDKTKEGAGSGPMNGVAGSKPAAAPPADSKLAQRFMADTKNTKIQQVGKPKTFLHALESFGEVKILASPRILVLNKQRAKVHVGNQLAYLASTPGPTGKNTKVKYIDLGTSLLVRPFVSPDGQIRLEAHMEYTTGRVDRLGVPQTNTWALTTNMMMRDGATVAIGGPSDVATKPAADDFAVLNWVPYLNWIPCLDYLLGGMDCAFAERQQVLLITTPLWRPQGVAFAQ